MFPRPSPRLLVFAFAAVLAGCADSESPTGPDPAPSGPPVIESFFATATGGTIAHGDFTQLRWQATGGTTSSIDDGSANVGALPGVNEGTISVRPYRTVTYTLTVRNAEGVTTATASVRDRIAVSGELPERTSSPFTASTNVADG